MRISRELSVIGAIAGVGPAVGVRGTSWIWRCSSAASMGSTLSSWVREMATGVVVMDEGEVNEEVV